MARYYFSMQTIAIFAILLIHFSAAAPSSISVVSAGDYDGGATAGAGDGGAIAVSGNPSGGSGSTVLTRSGSPSSSKGSSTVLVGSSNGKTTVVQQDGDEPVKVYKIGG